MPSCDRAEVGKTKRGLKSALVAAVYCCNGYDKSSMTLLLEPLAPVTEFPADGSRGLTIEELRDATRSMRNLSHLDHATWRMLPKADRAFLRDFTTRKNEPSDDSSAAYAHAKRLTEQYPQDVFDFIDAKAELRGAVIRLLSKDEWNDALGDPNFVAASQRGMVALNEGRVRRVRKEDL